VVTKPKTALTSTVIFQPALESWQLEALKARTTFSVSLQQTHTYAMPLLYRRWGNSLAQISIPTVWHNSNEYNSWNR